MFVEVVFEDELCLCVGVERGNEGCSLLGDTCHAMHSDVMGCDRPVCQNACSYRREGQPCRALFLCNIVDSRSGKQKGPVDEKMRRLEARSPGRMVTSRVVSGRWCGVGCG